MAIVPRVSPDPSEEIVECAVCGEPQVLPRLRLTCRRCGECVYGRVLRRWEWDAKSRCYRRLRRARRVRDAS